MVKNKFAALSCTALAAVMLAACGGEGAPAASSAQKQPVHIEVSSAALTIADVVTVRATFTPTSAGTPTVATLIYDSTKGTYRSDNLFLAPLTAPATYGVLVEALDANSVVIGTGTATGFAVTAGKFATLSVNVASNAEPLPAHGFIVKSFTSTGSVQNVNTGAPFSVVTAQVGASPTFLWTAVVKGTETAPVPTPCDGAFDVGNAASVTYTDPTVQVCIVSVTITDAVNPSITQTKSATFGNGLNVDVSGVFVPSPTVTQVVLQSNGGYTATWDTTKTPRTPKKLSPAEAPCTLYRAATVVGTTTIQGSDTCTGAYKINSGIAGVYPVGGDFPTWDGTPPAPVITLIAPTFAIGVTYDLGGVYDPAKPPKVGVTATCAGATTNGVTPYSFGATPSTATAGAGPGTVNSQGVQACPATGPCTGTATVFWTLPTAFTAPATNSLCSLAIKVDNQGAVDTFTANVFIQ